MHPPKTPTSRIVQSLAWLSAGLLTIAVGWAAALPPAVHEPLDESAPTETQQDLPFDKRELAAAKACDDAPYSWTSANVVVCHKELP